MRWSENGPLRVLQRTHVRGFLTMNASGCLADVIAEVAATCRAGDCVAMKPLVLHASSPATQVGHRRVIHLEFATGPLPGGLAWHLSAFQ